MDEYENQFNFRENSVKILISVLVLNFAAFTFAASLKAAKTTDKLRLPAQVGAETIRNILSCDFEKNEIGLNSIEVFAQAEAGSEEDKFTNLHTVTSLSGGLKMIYIGGTVSIANGSFAGKVNFNDQEATFVENKALINVNGKELRSRGCLSQLYNPFKK